jgi:hypothetical protein
MTHHASREETALAAVGAGVLQYANEIARRPALSRPVELIEVEPGESVGGALPPGSMLVLVGDDSALDDVRSAARAGDGDSLERSLRVIADRAEVGLDGGLAAVPVLTDVTYRGKVVAAGLPGGVEGGVSGSLALFAGGKVDTDGFAAVHSHTPEGEGVAQGLSSVVLIRQPDLSEVEKALLERLPEPDINATVAPPYATTIFTKAIELTSGAMPFDDPALAGAVRQRLPELHAWPQQNGTPEVDAQVRQWLDDPQHVRELEALDARAAVEVLVRLRGQILTRSS